MECLDLTGLPSKDILDLLDVMGGHFRSGSGEGDNVPSVEALVSAAEGEQGSQRTASRRGGDKGGDIDSSSSVSTSFMCARIEWRYPGKRAGDI